MKLAQGIIALTFTFFLGILSITAMLISGVFRNFSTLHTAHQTANMGVTLSVIFLIAAAFSFQIPLVSFIAFFASFIYSVGIIDLYFNGLSSMFLLISFAFTLFSLATWLVDRHAKKKLKMHKAVAGEMEI